MIFSFSLLVTSRFFSNLVNLNLYYCKLGNEGCQILRYANTVKIVNLSLKDNGISDDGVVELCKGNWTNLKDLNLEDNDISEIGINAIINSILKQLTFLRLKGNKRMENKDIVNIYNSIGNNEMEIDNEHKFTFLNYSQINYGAIRYCIRHPEIMEKAKK